MIKPKSGLGIVVLVTAQWGAVVACNSMDGGGGSGGGPASGGASSGGSASGGAASGGSGGTTPTCENFDPDEGDCGTCEVDLEELCDDGLCRTLDDAACQTRLPVTTLYVGCGYVHQRIQGDQGDSGDYVWEQSSGQLVYFHSTPSDSGSCTPNREGGEWPECDDWIRDCDGFGGAGGEGGGGP